MLAMSNRRREVFDRRSICIFGLAVEASQPEQLPRRCDQGTSGDRYFVSTLVGNLRVDHGRCGWPVISLILSSFAIFFFRGDATYQLVNVRNELTLVRP